MILLPDPVWPVVVLAVIVAGDGLLTFRPPLPLTCERGMSVGTSG